MALRFIAMPPNALPWGGEGGVLPVPVLPGLSGPGKTAKGVDPGLGAVGFVGGTEHSPDNIAASYACHAVGNCGPGRPAVRKRQQPDSGDRHFLYLCGNPHIWSVPHEPSNHLAAELRLWILVLDSAIGVGRKHCRCHQCCQQDHLPVHKAPRKCFWYFSAGSRSLHGIHSWASFVASTFPIVSLWP